ncbi:hypothetical protein LARI1_G003499 [Lachnellula arida]|uniref:Ipa protein n=1 Tax=Lachnellula arida TaxID=1316785 RepID=A0A8T9BEE3_9HELO|nr:hypothetical protein LARI1_G003499 [Lachnellula arida]
MDNPVGNEKVIKDLQRDLARKCRIHGAKIQEIWRSLDKGQRTQAVKAGAAEGMVLKHPSDRSMGDVFKSIPELNLRDITEPGSDYLLNILKHRATKLLSEQYIKGPDNGPGDHAVIVHNMRVKRSRDRSISSASQAGVARVSMKGKPELLTIENPRLHYMLRLCEPGVDASKAITWIKNLDDLHRSHPREREEMEESEFEYFGDLAVIVGFVQSLSSSLALPPMSLKKGQLYVSRSKELAMELDPLKSQLDLADFAIPIDNLTEPGMAAGALNALDQFIVNKTGTKMGFLYQDLIEKCVTDIQEYYQRQKTAAAQNTQPELPLATPSAETPEVRVEQRRQKHKTRPPHSSAYDIIPNPTTAESEKVEPLQIFKVEQDTAKTFSTLFSKSQSRGSITWMAFETAMADLKFSVIPKFGSVFMFCPPPDLAIQKSLTLHRPHKSQIEGHLLLIFASRLKRVYGWGEQSFEVA